MRSWLLSNTTYGTWLPGDPRGSVTSVRDLRSSDEPEPFRFEHHLPGEPCEDHLPGLHHAAIKQLKSQPVFLNVQQAETILGQLQETAEHRDWKLLAIAVMRNHFHLVVQVTDDPEPQKVLADFKAYASRALNRQWGAPMSKTWWTSKGSKRKLQDESHLSAAMNYVLHKQPRPLVVWSHTLGRLK